MAFTVQFAKVINKQRNSTFVPPVGGASTQVLLKDDTSIIRPTFRMHLQHDGMCSADELMEYNYCYCSTLKRYYWITNIIQITAAIFDIYCEVDVLATFRDDILNTEAFVQYASIGYNPMIPDSRIARSDSTQTHVQSVSSDLFDINGSFIIQVASSESDGDTGVVECYCLSKDEISGLTEKLYSSDFITKITDTFSNPDSALTRCMWVPIDKGRASGAVSTSTMFNDVDLGTYTTARRDLHEEIIFSPYIEYKTPPNVEPQGWADFRNLEPYSEYTLWLPGAGLVQLPMISMFGTGASQPQFTLKVDVSVPTGDIVYTINRMVDTDANPGRVSNNVLTVKGNIGVELPVSSYQSGMGSAISSALSAVGSMAVMAAAPPAAPFMIGGLITNASNTFINASQSQLTAGGSMGSFAVDGQLIQYACMTRVFKTSDSPSGIAKVIGGPVFCHKILSECLTGYVLCQGAYVQTWGTKEELDMISSFLNGGGVIIA